MTLTKQFEQLFYKLATSEKATHAMLKRAVDTVQRRKELRAQVKYLQNFLKRNKIGA